MTTHQSVPAAHWLSTGSSPVLPLTPEAAVHETELAIVVDVPPCLSGDFMIHLSDQAVRLGATEDLLHLLGVHRDE